MEQFKSKGAILIAREREEQLTKHGYTVKKDAAIYLSKEIPRMVIKLLEGGGLHNTIHNVPDEMWNRMIDKSYRDRVIIAGALLAAEVDRIDSVNIES